MCGEKSMLLNGNGLGLVFDVEFNVGMLARGTFGDCLSCPEICLHKSQYVVIFSHEFHKVRALLTTNSPPTHFCNFLKCGNGYQVPTRVQVR